MSSLLSGLRWAGRRVFLGNVHVSEADLLSKTHYDQ